MKTNYKGLIISFDREYVPQSDIRWYESTWANPSALIAEGGETIDEMCENLYQRVSNYAGEI